jgi:hypothetical protein
MPTNTSSTTAVSEADRFLAESSRRTTEGNKAAVEAARGFMDDAVAVNKQVFEALTSATEDSLKVTFEFQNANLAATKSLFESATVIQRSVMQQWLATVRQGQEAVLDGFRAWGRLNRP